MLVRFRVNLGSVDAKEVNDKTGARLEFQNCQIGAEHDIREEAAEWLIQRGIVEPVDRRVKGVAKQSEITAPAKS